MKLFSALLTYVKPFLKERSSLTKFQQLLLTLANENALESEWARPGIQISHPSIKRESSV